MSREGVVGVAAALSALILPAATGAAANGRAPTWNDGLANVVSIVGSQVLTLNLSAADPDPGETVRIEAVAGPPYATLTVTAGNPATATMKITAPKGIHGHIMMSLQARDGAGNTTSRVIVLNARPDTRPISLIGPGPETRWAYVLASTTARSAPRAAAPPVAVISTATSLGQPNLVSVIREQYDTNGGLWVQARIAILPNGTTGWIRSADLDASQVVTTHLWVDRSSLTARLTRNDAMVFRARIGIGRSATPTPGGTFYVRERIANFNDPMYGPIAFGTSGRSPTLTDWPGGGFIGIHGTNQPQLLPGRVSHGCIRMRNSDIVRLARLMPLGTLVTIT